MRVTIVGFWVERDPQGRPLRLVVQSGDGSEAEALDPGGLWEMLLELDADENVSRSTDPAAEPQRNGPSRTEGLFDAGCEQIGGAVANRYGPFFGQLARNVARADGPKVVSVLRRVSRR